jgi:hypothetical protein
VKAIKHLSHVPIGHEVQNATERDPEKQVKIGKKLSSSPHSRKYGMQAGVLSARSCCAGFALSGAARAPVFCFLV